jgi:plastocyanin
MAISDRVAPRRFRTRRVTSATATGLLLSALVALPAAAADEDVDISGFAYAPGTVTVNVGDSVTWTNADAQSHTASADDGSFDTSAIGTGDTGSVTFSSAGTFAYHCEFHPNMTGTVVVQGSSGTPPPTDTVAVPPPPGTASGGPAPAIVLGLVFAAGLVVGVRRFRAS